MNNQTVKDKNRDIQPTNKVIRRLMFDEPSSEERRAERIAQEQEMYTKIEEKKTEYNFDHVNDKPLQLPNARYINWEKVTPELSHKSVGTEPKPLPR